jgi:hypothetical protein
MVEVLQELGHYGETDVAVLTHTGHSSLAHLLKPLVHYPHIILN